MNSNSDNPKVGKAFQLAVKEWFEQARKVPYQMEKAIQLELQERTTNLILRKPLETWWLNANAIPGQKQETYPAQKYGP